MKRNLTRIRNDLRKLLQSQSLAVLSTQEGGQPYASLVAFASSNDLTRLYFATVRSTRKYANILKDSRVAVLVDNRANDYTDFQRATAVTATGRAEEVAMDQQNDVLNLYLAKHPYLKSFVQSPTCALCEVRVRTYLVVTRFQNVVEVHVSE